MSLQQYLSDIEKHYCVEYGRQARDLYPGRPWDEVEPNLKQCWEHNLHDSPWIEAKGLIKAEWSGEFGEFS